MIESQYIELDFQESLLLPIADLVRDAAPFVVSPSNIESPYDLLGYIKASKFSDVEFRVLVDNNILTRAISIAKGDEISGSDESQKVARLVCAVMCFIILAEFVIEPSMSIYEKASKSNHEDATLDLFYFQIADHIHPQIYAELALGFRTKITQQEISIARKYVAQNNRNIEENNFSKILDSWKLNYLFVLKAAELWKKSPTKIDAAKLYIEWMEKETFFNAIASLFSLLFLSPSRIPKMLKGIESTNINKFKSGLENCAWDLAYITQWTTFSRDAETSTIWFLCSNDRVMKQIANTVFISDEIKVGNAIKNLFVSYWGENDGKHLLETYQKAVDKTTLNGEGRDTRIHEKFSKIDDLILELEEVLRIKT